MINVPRLTNLHLQAMSKALVESTRKMLRSKGGPNLSRDPVIHEKRIVQFSRRMRVDALEKFGERTVFSTVNFYFSKVDMAEGAPVGCLVVYIPVSYISKLLSSLNYPRIDEEEEDIVLDACGTVTNLMAGYFVKEISAMGYVHLEMSHFESYINTAVNGIEFLQTEELTHEVAFEMGGQKRFVIEISMGYVPNY